MMMSIVKNPFPCEGNEGRMLIIVLYGVVQQYRNKGNIPVGRG
jgi:hypothetical protein